MLTTSDVGGSTSGGAVAAGGVGTLTSSGRRRPGAGQKKLAPLEDGVAAGGGSQKPRKIFAKKDLVEAVRRCAPANSGPVYRKATSKLFIPQAAPETSNQLKVMETGVNLNARRYNDLKSTADRKAVELKQRLDALMCLKMENDALRKMKERTTPESNRIEQLMEEIEKATKETDKKLHYRRQLEFMLRRLQKNHITFNAHINAMQDALEASEREHQEVKILMRQLEAGRTKGVLDLHEIQRQVSIERKERERTLSARRNEAKNATKMEEWRKERELKRAELTSEMRGDLSVDEERVLQSKLATREKQVAELREGNEEKQRQLSALEEQFMSIRQATGVNSLDEMVDKFVGQEGNRDALTEEKREVEARLAESKRKKEEAEQRFSELKASGIGSTELNREIADELNHKIQSGRMELKVTRAACERLEGVLVALRQGATGLFQRLQTFTHLLENDGIQCGDVATMEPIEAINLAEFILSKMMESVGGGEASPSHFGHSLHEDESHDIDGGPTTAEESSTWSSLGTDDLPNPRNNVRVKSHTERRAADTEDVGTDTRRDHGTIEEEAASDLSRDDNEAGRDMVPNREFIKLSSSRQHSEMLRKKETDQRRKKMQERLEAADEADRANMASLANRKKKQRDAINKLSEKPDLIGMPKGVTLKDDPMTRSNAFLTQMPELL